MIRPLSWSEWATAPGPGSYKCRVIGDDGGVLFLRRFDSVTTGQKLRADILIDRYEPTPIHTDLLDDPVTIGGTQLVLAIDGVISTFQFYGDDSEEAAIDESKYGVKQQLENSLPFTVAVSTAAADKKMLTIRSNSVVEILGGDALDVLTGLSVGQKTLRDNTGESVYIRWTSQDGELLDTIAGPYLLVPPKVATTVGDTVKG